jgi:hypothetical protein
MLSSWSGPLHGEVDVFAVDLDPRNAVVPHSGKDVLPLDHWPTRVHLLSQLEQVADDQVHPRRGIARLILEVQADAHRPKPHVPGCGVLPIPPIGELLTGRLPGPPGRLHALRAQLNLSTIKLRDPGI